MNIIKVTESLDIQQKRYFHGVIKAWNGLRIELIKYAAFLQFKQPSR